MQFFGKKKQTNKQTKIRNVLLVFYKYLVTASASAHEKVVWLNVSMNEILVVEIFNATYHLERKITMKMIKMFSKAMSLTQSGDWLKALKL